MSSTRHADYANGTAGLDLTHCDARSTARSPDLDRGRVEAKWSLDADPRSTSNPDPKSLVESPFITKRINALVGDINDVDDLVNFH